MKQTLHTSRRAFKLALFCLMLMLIGGGNYCLAQETAYKTLSFPDENKANNKVGSYEKTWTAKISDFSWEIVNFNNNYWNWSNIRAGRSKAASVAKIKNETPFDRAIGKVVVDIAEIANAKIKNINSIKFEVSSDGFQTIDQTITITSDFNNIEKHTFVVSNPRVGLYFRLTFDMKAGGSNGFVQINKVEYYEDVSNKTATSLSFDASSYTISKDQTLTKLPTLKADEKPLFGKTITWSSDNENVATVDVNGTVTGVAAGKAKITAKFAGDDVYETSTASYEIIVKGAPSLSFPQTSYTIEMGDAFSEPTLQGLPTGVTAKYSSSNADVATVDESTGKVQIVGVGTTTIKAVSEAKDVYEAAEASYELTVNRANSKKVTIDFSTFGYTDKQKVTEVSQDGITMTLANGSGYDPQWINDSKTLRFYNKNTLKIASNNRIKKVHFFFYTKRSEVSEVNPTYDAGDFQFLDAGKTEGELDLSACNTKEVTLTFSGKVFYTKMIVTTDVSVGTITIATPEGFGTYYNSNSYILPEGLTAFGYKEANTDGTFVKTEEFTGGDVVPANAALVVKGNEGEYECYATDKEAIKTLDGNLLKGVAAYKEIPVESGIKRYVLTTVNGVLGFYRTKSGNIKMPANRAYLELKETQAQAVSFFQLDGETTGIATATTTTKEAPKAIYTLSGVRLKATTTQELPAGAYVVNGKVVIVK